MENSAILGFLEEAVSGENPWKTIDEIKNYCIKTFGMICHVDKKTLNNMARDHLVEEIVAEEDGMPVFRYRITREGRRLAGFLREYGELLEIRINAEEEKLRQAHIEDAPFFALN